MAGERKERLFYAAAGLIAFLAVLAAGQACESKSLERDTACMRAGGQVMHSSCYCVPEAK